jgi:CBS-domain-containing membrane protein
MTSPRHATHAAEGLTVADVMHADVTTLGPSATVGDARAWFHASPSRRLALIADAGRYVGALTPSDVGPEVPSDRPAAEFARLGSTLAPDADAAYGRDAVLAAGARRVPVVDADGTLLGVLAVTSDERYFACREAAPVPAAGPPAAG